MPVIDAACLNIPVIANKIPSYKEIKEVIKDSDIELYNLNEESKWLLKLNQTEIFDISDIEGKISRIKNYAKICEIAKLSSAKKIKNLIETT